MTHPFFKISLLGLALSALIGAPAALASGTDQVYLNGSYYATVVEGTDIAAFMRGRGINVRYDSWDGHNDRHNVSSIGGAVYGQQTVTNQQNVVIVQPTTPVYTQPTYSSGVDAVMVDWGDGQGYRLFGNVREGSDVCAAVGYNCVYGHFNQAVGPNGTHYVRAGGVGDYHHSNTHRDDGVCIAGRSGSVAGLLCF